MLITIIIALALSYLLLPVVKNMISGMLERWNKLIGIIFLIPGVSLLVLLIAAVVMVIMITVASIQAAIEENFIGEYFKEEKHYD